MRSSDSSTKSGNSSASSLFSKEQEVITIEPRDNDVLYGRGFAISNHPGNQRYRSLVCTLKSEYDVAPKVLKGVYSNRIVQSVYSLDPPGRFLRMNRSSGLWEEVDEDNACDKARQALRDAPPQKPHIAGGSTPSSTIFTHGQLLEEKLLAKSKQQDAAAIQQKFCGDNAGLVILTPEEEKILRLQAENKLLKREVDSIQKEVEEIRNSFLK